jgi:hypothetical protein
VLVLVAKVRAEPPQILVRELDPPAEADGDTRVREALVQERVLSGDHVFPVGAEPPEEVPLERKGVWCRLLREDPVRWHERRVLQVVARAPDGVKRRAVRDGPTDYREALPVLGDA